MTASRPIPGPTIAHGALIARPAYGEALQFLSNTITEAVDDASIGVRTFGETDTTASVHLIGAPEMTRYTHQHGIGHLTLAELSREIRTAVPSVTQPMTATATSYILSERNGRGDRYGTLALDDDTAQAINKQYHDVSLFLAKLCGTYHNTQHFKRRSVTLLWAGHHAHKSALNYIERHANGTLPVHFTLGPLAVLNARNNR